MTAAPAVPATTTTASAATNAAPATTAATTTQQPAAKATTTAPAATAGGKIRVQLAAVKSEAAAKTIWAKLQKAHPAQLGNLTLIVEKVDKGSDGIFYRVQAGPLADKTTAKTICSALSQQGQACLIAH
jgi:cell division septation protein DedD